MTPGMVAILVIAILAVAIAIDYRRKRGKYRPLAHRLQDGGMDGPGKEPELGTEEIDIAAFNSAVRRNNAVADLTGANRRTASHTAVHLRPATPPKNDPTHVTKRRRTSRSERKEP